MEIILRQFDSATEADRATNRDDDLLTCEERFQSFMQLMAPYYESSGGFQRVYRVDDSKPRTIRDDWRLCVKPLPESRATGDIDFLVAADEDNELRLRTALTLFGFGSTLPADHQSLLVPGKVIMLGRAPLRIDILTEIDGVAFKDVYQTRLQMEIDGLEVPVISPEMLLKNKLAAGRPKDVPDAMELKAWLESRNHS